MIQVRVHGRGGQGAVTFAHILCASATFENKFGQSCMAPTVERRGAPVEAYGRIGDKFIAERGVIVAPDYVVVLNPMLVKAVNVEAGMGDSGMLVVNATKDLGLNHEATYIDATQIANDILNIPITNTVMLGAFAAATGSTPASVEAAFAEVCSLPFAEVVRTFAFSDITSLSGFVSSLIAALFWF